MGELTETINSTTMTASKRILHQDVLFLSTNEYNLQGDDEGCVEDILLSLSTLSSSILQEN